MLSRPAPVWPGGFAVCGVCVWVPCDTAGVAFAPRVFRAPEGPAAREARRPHFVRRRASKPARALRALRRPSHQWGWVAVPQLGASARCPARPRRPRAPQPGPPVSPAPSTPVRPGVLIGGSACRPVARPFPAAALGHRSQAAPRPSLTSLLSSPISHAIPPRLFQTLNSQR